MRTTLVLLGFMLGGNVSLADKPTGGYNTFGKRDPFFKKPLFSRDLASSEGELFRYRIDEFSLQAVRKGPDTNQILVSDPKGTNYILSEGDKISSSRATISRILEREVILSEQTTDYLGRQKITEHILSMADADLTYNETVPPLEEPVLENKSASENGSK